MNTATSTLTKPTVITNTKRMTITALFMAAVIALSSFGVPVPGGHLYLCDIAICLAALLLNPFEAFIACGVGAFLGDFLFYPLPMFVSLAVHGIQGIVISLIAHKVLKKHPFWASIIAVFVGAVIMVVGYTLGKIYVYSTFEYAMLKLPYEIAQAAVGAICGLVLCWRGSIRKLFIMIEKEELR
ncbi:MAG: ECF transporter S component [Eubacteriales bacterium]|nr:ECF transporter S component [Eubacteriales bacterium]